MMTLMETVSKKKAGEGVEAAPAGGDLTDEFTGATVSAATGVRAALTAFVAAVPGGAEKPRELERALGVDYKLAWKVFLLLKETDGMKMAGLVPKGPSIKRLLEAGGKKGLPEEVLEGVRVAAEKFDETVREQAGDRVAFDAMVSGKSQEEGGEKIGLVERRTAFRVNSHIWGTQTDTYTLSWIFKKSVNGEGEESGGIDRVHVLSRRGFKRFRRGAAAGVYATTLTNVEERDDSTYEAVDRGAWEKYRVGLLPEFCSQPVPQLKRHVLRTWIEYELVDAAFGQARAVDLAFGVVQRGAKLTPNAEGKRRLVGGISFRLPTEKALLELVVHRPSFGVVKPVFQFTTLLPDEQLEREVTDAHRLPIENSVHMVPGGLTAADTAEAPRLAEMVRHACGLLGWRAEEFDVYRMVVKYPVLHSTVDMGFWG